MGAITVGRHRIVSGALRGVCSRPQPLAGGLLVSVCARVHQAPAHCCGLAVGCRLALRRMYSPLDVLALA
eukprot:10488377-Alexandrium_andersonii.AAC.1